MKLDVQVNVDADKILKKYGLGQSKEAQRFLAEDVERLCQPYVPMSAGSGAHMVNAARVEDDRIIYPGPYAHYVYEGKVMGPNYTDGKGRFWSGKAPKEYTGKELQYHGAPKRGKHWDKRMMADHGDEVKRDMEAWLRRRNT